MRYRQVDLLLAFRINRNLCGYDPGEPKERRYKPRPTRQ